MYGGAGAEYDIIVLWLVLSLGRRAKNVMIQLGIRLKNVKREA